MSFVSLTLCFYYSHSLFIVKRYNQYCLVYVVRFLNIVDRLYRVVGSKKREDVNGGNIRVIGPWVCVITYVIRPWSRGRPSPGEFPWSGCRGGTPIAPSKHPLGPFFIKKYPTGVPHFRPFRTLILGGLHVTQRYQGFKPFFSYAKFSRALGGLHVPERFHRHKPKTPK
jgi:hypothetical protein